MDDFSRTDLRLMIQGLDRLLEDIRKILTQEGDAEDFSPWESEVYRGIANLQERLLIELARRVG